MKLALVLASSGRNGAVNAKTLKIKTHFTASSPNKEILNFSYVELDFFLIYQKFHQYAFFHK
jgi:hypothetical protein